MQRPISGIHPATATVSDRQRNFNFHTDVLGLRLVKRTVNFDYSGSYHSYFADELGSAGTILTFFPWPGAARGRLGAGQVTATSFRIR
jgi:glyoxalase family protein